MGPLPKAGEWARLEVDAAHVGLNAGAVLNQGVELLARARPYASGPVSVDLTFNVATNSNKILSLLPGVTSVSPGTFLQHHVGYPVGSWFARLPWS